MRKHNAILLAITMSLFLWSCKDNAKEEPTLPNEEEEDKKDETPVTEIIEISTSFGEMYIWLYPETPKHRANFIELSDTGFYDATEFHRIVTDFVIQGGDPNSKDGDRSNDGKGGPGYTIDAEIDSSLFKHKYGAVGAARLANTVNPERKSSGSQFYICVNPEGSSFLDGEYTVFGEVISGMTVAEEIVKQPKNSNNLPNQRIPMYIKVLQLTAEEIESRYGFVVEL